MRLFRVLISILVMCSVVFAATGHRYRPDGTREDTIVYTVSLSGAQTQTELVAAVSGTTWVVDKIICASATAGSFYFSDTTGGATTTNVDYGYCSVVANDHYLDNEVNMKFTSGEAVDITTTHNLYVHIEYHAEQ